MKCNRYLLFVAPVHGLQQKLIFEFNNIQEIVFCFCFPPFVAPLHGLQQKLIFEFNNIQEIAFCFCFPPFVALV